MHVTLSAEELKKALVLVQALVPDHLDVLVTAYKESQIFTIEAGHGGTYIFQSLPAKVVTDGRAVFNSPYFTSLYIRGEVTFAQESQGKIRFSSSKLKGSIEVNQDFARIEALRPEEDFEISTTVPRKVLASALARTNFSSSMQDGVRIKLGANVTVEATDQFRIATCKESLGKEVTPFDVVVNPVFITKVLSKLDEPEIWFGLKNGCIKIATPNFICFFPSIQIEPQDLEAWLAELDQSTCKGAIETTVEEFRDSVLGSSSISTASGTASYETKLRCRITGDVVETTVESPHGSAESVFTATSSTVEKLAINLSSKYTIEMLSLLKTGKLTLQFWDDFIVMFGCEGCCIHAIPVIN